CLLFVLLSAGSKPAQAYVSCCRRYMVGRIRYPDIKGFSVQNNSELCPISAIIFHTTKGKRCANPALEWVMDYVNRIETHLRKNLLSVYSVQFIIKYNTK
uniref:C-C motif chemokine n=1 Tax=Fundulus heteroclitus TaxID=8078 RepID=A0A3Q2NSP6_FUNHE